MDRLRYVAHQEHLFSLFSNLHEVNFLSVIYEDLIADTEGTLREVLAYVGAPKNSVERLGLIRKAEKHSSARAASSTAFLWMIPSGISAFSQRMISVCLVFTTPGYLLLDGDSVPGVEFARG